MGLAPAAESREGDVLLRRPTEHRTPPRSRPRPVSPLPPAPGASALLAAVRALRAADDAARARSRDEGGAGVDVGEAPVLAPMDPAGVLAVLRDAAARHEPAWIGYADATGQTTRRLVEPLSVEAGRIHAFDRAAEQVRVFSVHRVTGVAPAAPR
jgi:predicted DNA-binding transcriptional regulator YafY